jgi:hypothetical protein
MKKKINKNLTIDDLGAMVAKGFEHIDDEFGLVKNRLESLEDGQEQIKLPLDNVAYRFELIDVQRRVTLLEKRAGIKR